MQKKYTQKEKLMIIDNHIAHFKDVSDTFASVVHNSFIPLTVFLVGLVVTIVGSMYYAIKYGLLAYPSILTITFAIIILIFIIALSWVAWRLIHQVVECSNNVVHDIIIKKELYNLKHALLTHKITDAEFAKKMIETEDIAKKQTIGKNNKSTKPK